MPNVDIFKHDPNLETFASGDVIFREGDPPGVLYIVVEGEIEIRIRDVVREVAGAGVMFGELALIDEAPRTGTAIARTAAKLVPVDRKRFLYLVQNTPHFALEVLRTISERVRRMDASR